MQLYKFATIGSRTSFGCVIAAVVVRFGACAMGTRHKPLSRSLTPSRTGFPSLMTSTFLLLNDTVHPASHSTGAEMRLFVMPGRRCAICAWLGRDGRSRNGVPVVVVFSPFGIVTRFEASWVGCVGAVAD